MASFNAAFAAARKAGKKAFTWNGKRFNTKLSNGTPAKGPKPSSRPAKLPESVKVPGSRPSAEKTASTKAPAKAADRGAPGKPLVKVNTSLRAKENKGPMGGQKLTIGGRVLNSIRIGKTAVDRGHRRDAAQAKNAGAGKAVGKMLSGMDKRKKK